MVHETQTAPVLKLPLGVVGPIDASHLLREIEAIEDFLSQATIRNPGSSLKLPRTGWLLEEFMTSNQLNLLQPNDRLQASAFLKAIIEKAPVLYISFASTPSAAFTGKIVAWLRSNIDPQLLLRIGLEPTIAAGCVVRTGSRQFDFSLRKHFADERDELMKLLNVQVNSV